MAGDPIRDAFRAKLQDILDDASPPITWPVIDTDNGEANPDGAVPYIEIRFEGGNELPFARGGDGSSLWLEDSQAFIDFVVPLGDGREEQERNAYIVRNGFRGLFFNTSPESGAIQIEIVTAAPLGGGQGIDGGMNAKTIALGYRIYNVG